MVALSGRNVYNPYCPVSLIFVHLECIGQGVLSGQSWLHLGDQGTVNRGKYKAALIYSMHENK